MLKFLSSSKRKKEKAQDGTTNISNMGTESVRSSLAEQSGTVLASHEDMGQIIFAKPPPKHLYCPMCHKVFKNPLKMKCSHAFCAHCIEENVLRDNPGNSKAITCPVCKDVFSTVEEETNLIPAHQLRDEIGQLLVYCKYRDKDEFRRLFYVLAQGEESDLFTESKEKKQKITQIPDPEKTNKNEPHKKELELQQQKELEKDKEIVKEQASKDKIESDKGKGEARTEESREGVDRISRNAEDSSSSSSVEASPYVDSKELEKQQETQAVKEGGLEEESDMEDRCCTAVIPLCQKALHESTCEFASVECGLPDTENVSRMNVRAVTPVAER